MAAEDNFIVAIELGSSKVTGIAGRKQPDGAIQVLAYHQEPSTAFLRKGRIFNVEKMNLCVNNMKEKLEKTLKKSINQVYVGIGGMGMHSVSNTVVRSFNEKTVINEEIIESMLDANGNTSTPNREILYVQPLEYKFGNQQQLDPIGVLAEKIEGNFLNIVANSALREQTEKTFYAAEMNVADMPIAVKLQADLMLSEAEKRSGCVFVDMGAETTTVAVYKGNLLRHLAVIPLGGANITRDIMSLNIEEEEAELLKLTYGKAYTAVTDNEQNPIVLSDGRSLKMEEFNDIVEARVEEIILNINNQIMLSEHDKSLLIGGIIVTGGAANLENMEKALEKYTGFDKIRFVKAIRMTIRTSFQDFNKDGSCNAALALLASGTKNCCGGELGSNGGSLFNVAEQTNGGKSKKEEEAEKEAALKRAIEAATTKAKDAAEQAQQTAAEAKEATRKASEDADTIAALQAVDAAVAKAEAAATKAEMSATAEDASAAATEAEAAANEAEEAAQTAIAAATAAKKNRWKNKFKGFVNKINGLVSDEDQS